jgi:pyruvate formate lyase activating enzyme
MVENLGNSVPVHFTAYHPDFKLTNRPPTPAATLKRARHIARSVGVKYCYVGNIHDRDGQTTYCPACQRALIRRSWHEILEYNLDGNCCPCGETIPGVFSRDRNAPQSRRPRQRLLPN